MYKDFLPVSREDMFNRNWYYYDFLLVTGDAYVDHPSFGAAVIGRALEAQGHRVAVLAQPAYNNCHDFEAMGRPRYAALVTAGNLDSMVARYTAAKKPRSEDHYSPGKRVGLRPNRATTVYAKLLNEAFNELPIIIGGLEASLRRFAHYDYWDNEVKKSILFDARADMLIYGMGENAVCAVAKRLAKGEKIHSITDIRGIAYITSEKSDCRFSSVVCKSYEQVMSSKKSYARAAISQYYEHDPIKGKAVIQQHGHEYLIVNPPALPLNRSELDKLYSLPFVRESHPKYEKSGGVSALEEVQFSVIHNRGCFGSCNFCALSFHQGRMVTSRSHNSVLSEIESFSNHPKFKGYVHDIGGPTANFRNPSCKKQIKEGLCKRCCLVPEPCRNLNTDHNDYLSLLRKASALPHVKKVFIRSGIRYDFLMHDKSGDFIKELVKNHVSGQLKVAPEHCTDGVLHYMGKPSIEIFEKFIHRYRKLNASYGKKQYLVPYLISSHPGSSIDDAIMLAEYLNKSGSVPEQVQDFYPTPGTLSTCMYYTELDPRTLTPVYVPKSEAERATQRALLQWKSPKNKNLVRQTLRKVGRQDLIGYDKSCLVKPQK